MGKHRKCKHTESTKDRPQEGIHKTNVQQTKYTKSDDGIADVTVSSVDVDLHCLQKKEKAKATQRLSNGNLRHNTDYSLELKQIDKISHQNERNGFIRPGTIKSKTSAVSAFESESDSALHTSDSDEQGMASKTKITGSKKHISSKQSAVLPKGKKNRKKNKTVDECSDEEIQNMLAELESEYAEEQTTVKKPHINHKPKTKSMDQFTPDASADPMELQDKLKNNIFVGKEKRSAHSQYPSVKLNDEKNKLSKQKSNQREENELILEKEDLDRKDKSKRPGRKALADMKEALKKLKEEEERRAQEEAEEVKRFEELEQLKQEKIRLEQERKEKKKQKERDRKERLKAEGKLLTAKQKADKLRAQAMIDALKAQGVDLVNIGEKKARMKFKNKTSRNNQRKPSVGNVESDNQISVLKEENENVGDDQNDECLKSWDATSSSDNEEMYIPRNTKSQLGYVSLQPAKPRDNARQETLAAGSYQSNRCVTGEEEKRMDAARKREKVVEKIKSRRLEAEKARSAKVLRAAVVCVLGHVDTGKTKLLDKLRRTHVQDREAGGITQQIGATNVPIDAIRDEASFVRGFSDMQLKIPGLLIIDTPGHESFSNLRSRGSSLCDIAILVVDIMHGLEPQTIESINLLKGKKTPFIVALNKIDRLYGWESKANLDIRDIIQSQAPHTQREFQQRTNEVITQFAEQSLNAALFYDSPDIRCYVSLVPTSAITGEGIGNLLALIVESCQRMLCKRLMYSEEVQATVLEVKTIGGLGTTIDAILLNGKLREGDSIVLAGTDGPIVTQIRALLMPQPMKELRVKNSYVEYKEIKAAQGVKIAAKDLDKAIAGLNLRVVKEMGEVDVLKEEVAHELQAVLRRIKLQERGVSVQASTLGSLEALLEFLDSSKIPYSSIKIGPVVKKDVMKASAMLEHDGQYATILAFDVKIERDAQELADLLGVKIFQADIIYHLFDRFTAYREELLRQKREEFRSVAVFPCKLKILPQYVFNSRDPIILGVIVEAGVVKEGTPLCVPSRDEVDVGIVSSIESNHKAVSLARKGQEVCIKIETGPGETPKMYGRHFDENDLLVSKISRQSIDACKNYFRDDLLKSEWQLMVELKKLFQIT